MIETDDGFLALLDARVETDPDGLFALYNGEPITFGEIDRRSDTLAAWLRSDGVAPGERIALMIRNSPAALALLFAIGKAAAVWVPVNVQARGDNLAYVLGHSGPERVIADHDVVETIMASGAEIAADRIWTLGDPSAARSIETLLEDDAPFDEALPSADDLYAIMYTSGTTGRPKGVMVTHRMLRFSGETIALVSEAREGDVFHMWEPLFHIGGAQMIVMPLISPVHLAMVDRFSASGFWNEVARYKATHIHFLGGILQLLLKQPAREIDRTHGARIGFGGGCPPDVWRAFEDRFGVEIRESYGMTEASSITTYNTRNVVGSTGRPVPWLEVEICDAEGRPVETGMRGEIVVREKTPGVLTAGYYKNPEATEKALRGGALHTGDIGSFDDDGNMYFHGRDSDNVRVRGENVTAWEVEHVAVRHPAVEDCAMIGIDAEIGEQDIKLFVKLTPGADLDPADLSHWLGDRLAAYQSPRYIAIVDDFERTPSQRIMKHRLPTSTEDAWRRD